MTVLTLVIATLGISSRVAASTSRTPDYYVSVGDSYAAGYQPTASALHGRDTHGFAYQLIPLAKRKGDDLSLRDFACDGATTASVLQQKGCDPFSPGPSAETYAARTQATAAEEFIAEHRGRIGLITVSLGGNDILGCTAASTIATCISNALQSIRSNMAVLLAGLRQAAGAGVPIVGLTYPDVFLGTYVSKDASARALAVPSVPAFEDLLNPSLEAAYSAVGASFIDVTAATGGYTPFSVTSATPKYGTIPTAVADVCALTYYCQRQDVHPTTLGYAVMARLIVKALPNHHRPRP